MTENNNRPGYSPALRRGSAPRQLWIALGWLAVGLILTGLASLYLKAEVEAAAQREFDFISNEIRLNIADRLAANAQILHSGAALFDVSETVTRQEWQTFTQSLNVEQQLPGIQGIGFAQLIPPGQLAAHVQEIRDQGFPDYQVWPAGDRETYTAIIYLEPFLERNLRAFGYDMFSEPVRRAAMERARDEDNAALSGKVVLVQETGQDVQAGALMYVPVYRHGLPLDTIEQRRAALRGWVYSPYRMADLMRGTLRGWEAKQQGQITLQVYDGEEVSADNLLYDSQSAGEQVSASTGQLTRLIPIDFAGHRWTLHLTQLGGLASVADYDSVWLFFFSGTIISLLLFGLTLSWLNTRDHARRIQESEERYRILIEWTPEAIAVHQGGTLIYVNPATIRMMGATSAQELVGTPLLDLVHPDFHQIILEQAQNIRDGGFDQPRVECSFLKLDGTVIDVEYQGTSILYDGKPAVRLAMRDITERKQAAVALRESEERLHRAEKVAHFGNWELNLAERKIRASAGARAIYGLPGAEWALAEVQSLPLPEYRAMMDAALTHLIDHHHPYNIEFRIRRPSDGQLRDIHSMAEYDPDRGVVFGVINDITGRKQAEEALRQSEARWETIINTSPDGISIVSMEGVIQFVSGKLLAMHGYERPEDMVGKNIFEFVDAAYHEPATAKIQEMLNGHYTGVAEYRLIKKDGSRFYIDINAEILRDDAGRPVSLFFVERDATARKEAEKALRESEEKHKSMIANISDVIAIMGPDGLMKYKSPNIEKWFGWQPEDLVGTDGWATVHPDDLERMQTEFLALLQKDHSTKKVEYRYKCKDGRYKWIELTAVNLVNDPLIKGVLMNYHDITGRKRAEAAQAKLEARNRQLEKAESLGRMAGAIAHHFNNQLQAVLGNLELAMMRDLSSQNLSQAMLAAHRAAEMSSLMLVYLGQTPDLLEPLDLAGICAGSLASLRELLPPGVALEIDLPGPGPVINANAARLHQLLTNMVANAWESLDDSPGVVQLAVTTVSAADIPASPRFPLEWQPQEQPYACLTVTDTGVGIAAPDIEKLFDPFFSTKFTGRGLGLAVVLGIVRSHFGAVTVESRPGQGSAFRLFFPVLAQTTPAPAPPGQAAQPPVTEEGGTVLLVDDDNLLRHMVAEMLAYLGFTVLTAVDGVEAVELFRQRQADIDCVLCDLTMPRMDGWAALTALRQIAPDIPVILSSGYDEAQVMAGHHPDRPQAFLRKPYQMNKADQVIRQVLAARKMQS